MACLNGVSGFVLEKMSSTIEAVQSRIGDSKLAKYIFTGFVASSGILMASYTFRATVFLVRGSLVRLPVALLAGTAIFIATDFTIRSHSSKIIQLFRDCFKDESKKASLKHLDKVVDFLKSYYLIPNPFAQKQEEKLPPKPIKKDVPIHIAKNEGKDLKLNAQDIGVLAHLQLGFRHAPTGKQGEEECKEGIKKGDAVSLAGYRELITKHKRIVYGRDSLHCSKEDEEERLKRYKNIREVDDLVQLYNEQIPAFIKISLNSFSSIDPQHVFILLKRDRAKYPYDFTSYPLGKCGTTSVEQKDLYCGIKLEQSNTMSLDQKVHVVFQTFVEQVKTLSLQHAEEAKKELQSIEEEISSVQRCNSWWR